MSLLLSLFILWSEVQAAEVPLQPQSSAEMEMKARKRLYPGGCDEEELKVLENLPEASVKVSFRSIQKEVLGDLIKDDIQEATPESE